ncbi:hypothetical protein [Clostridium botulinum]|uniref:hypothetical protein n=1 Tax=Clostridium botulinum TaxID=1491 RepID=UPI001969C8FF|nr:hypothetical protein [Clostridium botulinum]MBN3421778.1 hypothetical protein [Clostridium botulinum]
MNKKLITLVASLAILTVNVPVFASSNLDLKAPEQKSITTDTKTTKPTTANEFLNSDIGREFHATLLDEVPKDAKVIKFNTYSEAYDFMKSIKKEYDANFTKAIPNELAMVQNRIGEGVDYYQVGYATLPSSGTGTVSGTVKWNVPGLSAQTVTSGHYFNYSGHKVTGSSRGSYISGAGLATWQQYYSGMTHPSSNRWHSTIRGKCGYFISAGGQNLGMSQRVELTCVCK